MKSDYQPILNENNVTKWIDICAWCDVDKSITKKYMCEGYRTSHGICEKHKDEAIKETIEYYEKNGFDIGGNDNSNDRLPIVRGTKP